MGEIFDTLSRIGLASAATKRLLAMGTRDVPDLPVYIDERSGVIFIDEYFTGTETYASGRYREEKKPLTGEPSLERLRDARRRLAFCEQFVAGRSVMDFGCGAGEFLGMARPIARAVAGVELQEDYIRQINDRGIPCYHDVSEVEDQSFDTVTLFHTMEHLQRPIEALRNLRQKMKQGGTLIVEVPHARDLLIAQLRCEPFHRFTLWSQHLILHTRESLARIVEEAGFGTVTVQGAQRYPLSNHLVWLAFGIPGGHKGMLSAVDSPAMSAAYEAALQKIDATDTLIAVATA